MIRSMIRCKRCGEPFEGRLHGSGSQPDFCSEVCRHEAELEHKRASDRRRYAADPARRGRPALCHPDRPRKTKDGLCDACYGTARYRARKEFHE